jgi:hypothetical protein
MSSDLHEIMSIINSRHFEANPDPIDPDYIEEMKQDRDRRIAALKAQGKRVILVKGGGYEDCGRYVCEGEDGFNGYSPLPGTVTTEEEV